MVMIDRGGVEFGSGLQRVTLGAYLGTYLPELLYLARYPTLAPGSYRMEPGRVSDRAHVIQA